MKSALAWGRSNPISTGAAFTALVSLIWLFVIHANGVAFTDRISERSKVIDQIKALEHTKVKVPPAQPDEPERRLQITVNQAAIDQLARVYRKMNKEYTEIFELAVQLNQGQHVPMLKGLFPSPLDAAMPFEARRRYRNLMTYMVSGRSKQPDYPRLNASPRLSPDKINRILKKVEKDFLANMLTPKHSVHQLTGEEAQQLDAIKSDELLSHLNQHARSIHLYAVDQIESSDYPLDVGAWSKPGLRPRMSAVWEGQIGLWIQQDIVEAIARTNDVEDPESNVIYAPIKRLVYIRIAPDAAGLAHDRSGSAVSRAASGRVGGSLAPGTPAARLGAGDTDARVQDDFSFSMTGRRSNAMYDVRHVNLSLVLDSRKIPVFFEHLHRVNFMTVLKMEVTAVDEYEALREGYVYGSGDAVRADMLIETIWLRDWTAAYMPELARNSLDIRRP